MDPETLAYDEQLHEELKNSTVMDGFSKQDEDEDGEIDVDLNLVANFLESFSSQQV